MARLSKTFLYVVVILLVISAIACSQTAPSDSSPDILPTIKPTAAVSVPPTETMEITDSLVLSDNNLAIAETCKQLPDAGEFSILFINVHKADAALLSVEGKHYLIDTGEKETTPIVLGVLQLMGIKALDGVFLTHTHNDHTGALPLLSELVPIHTLFRGEFSEENKNGKLKLDKMAEECNLPVQVLSAGDTLLLTENCSIEVLGPTRPTSDDDNDQSLVLMVHIDETDILLTGDMQFEEESYLLDRDSLSLKADILKVGNHGNPDATSDAFACAVSPKISIISTDTTVDTDSANERVLSALSMSHIYCTEQSSLGLLLHSNPEGSMIVEDITHNHDSILLSIEDVSISNQTVFLHNYGSDLDLSGFMILSSQGCELFRFPDQTFIPADSSISIGAGKQGNSADFYWDDKKVWSSKKQDTAILYDPSGCILDTMEAH